MKLYYTSQAKTWIESLPLGNGNIGLMLDGGVENEKIYVNDDTLWSGYPKDHHNYRSAESLKRIRELIFEGNTGKAEKLIKKTSLGDWSESYEPLGLFELFYTINGKVSNYRRSLDLINGIHRSSFDFSENTVEKEAFCSYPQKIAAVKISSKKPMDFTVLCSSLLKHKLYSNNNKLFVYGNAPDNSAPNYCRTPLPVRYNKHKAMAFCAGMKVDTDGKIISDNNKIVIKGSMNTMLYISTATGFNGFDKMPCNDSEYIKKTVENKLCETFDYYSVKARHSADFSTLMNRVGFELYSEGEAEAEAADVLIAKAKKDVFSPRLAELYYQYARYLTVSGSRPGTQALNLQGIWNDDVRPPWSSNYTTDINIEMNYWFTACANLRECTEPYESLVRETAVSGEKTAEINYGCKGFCANVNIDIWRKTTPVKDDPVYAYYPLGGLWMSNELYRITEYEPDNQMLKRDFGIFEKACIFAMDWLVEYNGRLVTCPSSSPEVHYKKDKGSYSMSYATAFDMSVIRETLNCYIKSCEKLNRSGKILNRAKEAIEKLYPLTVDEGMLNEWHKDCVITEKGHRHFSPLYGVYPGSRVNYCKSDISVVDGCKKLLEYRLDNGSGQTGWSAAWASCLAARFHNGELAYDCLKKLWKESTHNNFFDKHPPIYFQIDGNLGGAAGIQEMLIQCSDGITELLPALPEVWSCGKINGLIINGGIEVSFEWKDSKVINFASSDNVTLSLNNIDKKILTNRKLNTDTICTRELN